MMLLVISPPLFSFVILYVLLFARLATKDLDPTFTGQEVQDPSQKRRARFSVQVAEELEDFSVESVQEIEILRHHLQIWQTHLPLGNMEQGVAAQTI